MGLLVQKERKENACFGLSAVAFADDVLTGLAYPNLPQTDVASVARTGAKRSQMSSETYHYADARLCRCARPSDICQRQTQLGELGHDVVCECHGKRPKSFFFLAI